MAIELTGELKLKPGIEGKLVDISLVRGGVELKERVNVVKKVSIDDVSKTTSSNTSLTRRWFCGKPIPAGAKISTLKFNRTTAVGAELTTYAEVWELSNEIYTLVKSMPISEDKTTGIKTVTIDYVTNNPAIISLNGESCGVYTVTNEYTYLGAANDVTSTSIAAASITKYAGGASMCIYVDYYDVFSQTNIDEINNTIRTVALAPFINDLAKTTSSQASLTRRWFYMLPMAKGTKINTVKYNRPVPIATASKVEVWEANEAGDTYNLVKSVTVSDLTAGLKTINIDYITQNTAVIALNAEGIAVHATTANKYTYLAPAGDLTSTTLATSAILYYNGGVSMSIYIDGYSIENYVNFNVMKAKSNLVTVGVGCDFANVQDALDYVDDKSSNHVTIQVFPGVYPRFSMVREGSEYIAGYPVRYVSIIGVNPYRCLIKDDTGNYHTPPGELKTNGLVYGLGFIATHDVPVADPDEQGHKSYAAHIDFGACDMQLEWCRFISNQAPGIGMGLAQDMKVKIKNCDIESYSTADYGTLVDYGGIFVHSQDAADITSQVLILDNNRIYSQNGNKSLWLSHMSSGTSDWKISAYNNLCYGATCAKTVSISKKDETVTALPTITSDSYGNNVTELNPT